jgi:ribosomal protein S6--L-glutamate ligase
MILSFNPVFEADVNRICAGRNPNADDLAALRRADAVILPQGCRRDLYALARENCRNVFPNYDTRFAYDGKIAQIQLFRRNATPHPPTFIYGLRQGVPVKLPLGFPLVLKLDWGGEGDSVFLVSNRAELKARLTRIQGNRPVDDRRFMLQQFVPCGNRSLRVAVIGSRLHSYWRVQPNATVFGTALVKGADIDYKAEPRLQQSARQLTRRFCRREGIDLAGLDFIFPLGGRSDPLLLEINWFFGRRGLGGSQRFYRLLEAEIDGWLQARGLSRRRRS